MIKTTNIPLSTLVEAYEPWIIEAVEKSNKNEPVFNTFIVQHIAEWGKYVSELEVKIIQHVLDKCGIDLRNPISNIQQAPRRLPENTLMLVNINNNHYNYVRYPRTEGGRRAKTQPSTQQKKSPGSKSTKRK
jgi:hypothetical protein